MTMSVCPRSLSRPTAVGAAFGTLLLSASLAAQQLSDIEIITAIEHEYLTDDFVPFNRVDVASEDGVVTLSGRVSNLAARMHAEEIASIVRGVRSIVNRIEVATTPQSDDELVTGISKAWMADPTTDDYEIEARSLGAGIVRLTGTVDSWAERSLAEDVAMTVPGVLSIENRIEVDRAQVYRGEADIAADIEGRLRWDARVDGSLVDVLVRDGGRVILSGTVGSLGEKRLAARLALVEGVNAIDSQSLEVEPWARNDDLRRGQPILHENEVEDALRRAIRYDPRINDENVDVIVEAGTALLRGSVDNLQAKRAAERDAYNTVGIDRVFNHLKIRAESLSDAEIADFVNDALSAYGMLNDDDIDVDVSDRVARLTGDVDTMVEYQMADQAASAVRGIEDLHNDLTVRDHRPIYASYWYGYYPRFMQPPIDADGLKSDRAIHEDVASELYWSPFVDRDSVAIDVDDGIVTLSGTVDSRRERRAARDNAFEGGARIVQNDLVVE